jgi:hypothetical protein
MDNQIKEKDVGEEFVQTIVSGAELNFLRQRRVDGIAVTLEMLQEFRNKVTESISESLKNQDDRADILAEVEEQRQLRLYLVEEKAAGVFVKFQHNRRKTVAILDETIEEIDFRTIQRTTTEQLVPDTFGGETFAYIYKLDEQNRPSIVYATAFCRVDDPDEPPDVFDPIVGKEIALAKFLAGKVLEFPSTHGRLSSVQMDRMARAYRRAEAFSVK